MSGPVNRFVVDRLGLRSIAASEHRCGGSKLNSCEERRKASCERESQRGFTVRTGGSRACPQQRNEAVVIAGLHVAVQKDHSPNGGRGDHPCAPSRERCLESKALKVYLWSYRDEGAFCESLAARIADDIMYAIAPQALRVQVNQNVRGGIALAAVAVRGNARAAEPGPEDG